MAVISNKYVAGIYSRRRSKIANSETNVILLLITRNLFVLNQFDVGPLSAMSAFGYPSPPLLSPDFCVFQHFALLVV